ncbi:hypothetical protein Mgra_00005290 [Meloidogyne graminicola]|uniref:Uncharacterized protein n=1 Tax=Meloidogyne graminicola TaxID=189291 RepID=A0A8S9ZPY9_9BILA|nr:hypothetical protein Mgra_00005290 [Meloidogyne graminicola]
MISKVLLAIVLLQLVLETINAQGENKYPEAPENIGDITTKCPHTKKVREHKVKGEEKHHKKGGEKKEQKNKKSKKGGKTKAPKVVDTTDGEEIIGLNN